MAEGPRRWLGWLALVALALLVGLGYAIFGSDEPMVESAASRPGRGQRTEEPETVRDRHQSHADRREVRPQRALGPSPVDDSHDAVYDPQRAAMRRAFRVTSADAGGALPFEPLERAATITSITGAVPFDADASCTARVLPARSGRLNCLVRVICDARIVYPNQPQTAGFVRCEFDEDGRPLRASDGGHTALDGDPLIRVDLAVGELVVEDRGDGVEAFRVVMRLR